MKIFNKLFSIKSTPIFRCIVYFFGIKFTFTNKKIIKKYCITKNEWIDFIEKINGSQYANEGESLFFLRDKTILLNRLKDNLKREFTDIEKNSFDEFIKFIDRHKKFIAKIKTGAGGKGMKIYDLNYEHIEKSELYSELKKNNTCLLEEYVNQCELLNKIYPEIVSTIRIYTLNINGSTELISYPLIRIPLDKSGVYNKNLIEAKINPYGICENFLVLNKKKKIKVVKNFMHPYSNCSILNLKIPYFEEVKNLALKTAKLIPEIVFAGWDIAITDDGPVIIEGNGAPYTFKTENHIAVYKNEISRKEYYSRVLEYYNFRKNLTLENIKEAENKVFLPESDFSLDFDFVIILGSSSCEYRAEHFCKLYENALEIPTIIASGGNNFSGEYEYAKIYNVLIKNNIPQSKIILEKKSENTSQNLANSFKIIDKLSLNYKSVLKERKLKVGIITAGFHSVRTYKLSEKYKNSYDIAVISAYGRHTTKNNWYKSFTGYQIITDEIKRAMEI